MKPILLLLLSVCICAAEVPVQNEKLPNDVVVLLNSYDKDMAKIKNDAEVAMSVRTEKLRPALIKAQEAATKKGNLEAAMAIKDVVDGLNKGDVKVAKTGTHSSKDVILYTQPDFQGEGIIFKDFNNVTEAWKIKFPNDGLRSVKVPKGVEFIAYTADLGGGEAFSITSDMGDLTGTPALGMTSFMIKRVK